MLSQQRDGGEACDQGEHDAEDEDQWPVRAGRLLRREGRLDEREALALVFGFQVLGGLRLHLLQPHQAVLGLRRIEITQHGGVVALDHRSTGQMLFHPVTPGLQLGAFALQRLDLTRRGLALSGDLNVGRVVRAIRLLD